MYNILSIIYTGGRSETDETRTETLQFKVTESERKLIEKCATDEGTTVSKYVRGAVLMSLVDGREGRSHQDCGQRSRRESVCGGTPKADPTYTGRTLRTVLSVAPSTGNPGPRRMPIGCGAERNGPRLGNTGALPTALLTGGR